MPHYVAPAGLGFEIGVGDDVVHQLVHVDGFLHFGELAGFQAKQFEKVTNGSMRSISASIVKTEDSGDRASGEFVLPRSTVAREASASRETYREAVDVTPDRS